MPLPPGTRIGPYEVVGPLGAGGMGEVFRARDTRLGRDVALKILPDAFAADPDRLMRFEREARTLASLNHPHIAQLHGVEDAGGTPALVMEFVEGENLSWRIARGPLPLDEALPIARQIAEALEAAHELGIVHRDLKPANIKVRDDGTVKVLDFGLAKALDPAVPPGSFDLANSPTITSPALTMRGVILGTAAYMAPEQAKGKPVDKRADIWAFGCVLYEMLTGERGFKGEDSTDTIAAVVTKEPDWTRLPSTTPSGISRLLRRCLVKDRRNRLPDIAAARLDIDDAKEHLGRSEEAAPASFGMSGRRLLWMAIAVALGLVAGLWFASTPAPPSTATVIRFAVTPSDLDTSGESAPEISPDGGQLLFSARPRAGGAAGLYLHDLRLGSARRLEGTDGAASPFWSGDGRSVGFVVRRRLMRTEVAGGNPRAILDVQDVFLGAAWNRDDVIVLSLRFGFYKVPAGGGTPTQVTTLDRSRQENSHRWPQFLPDGQRFVFVARSGRPERSSAYVGFLDGRPPVRLMEVSTQVRYSASGHLVYVRDDTLVAQAIDASSLAFAGDPIRVADGVRASGTGLRARFSLSDTGVLVHQSLDEPSFQLRWYDQAGHPLGTLGAAARIGNFRIAPDATRVVVDLDDNPRGGRSVWVADVESGNRTPVTFGESDEWLPIWSRNGEHITFGSYRNGPLDVYQRPVSGATGDSVVIASEVQKSPTDSSRDGRIVLVDEQTAEGRGDVVAFTVDAGTRTTIAGTTAVESRGRFSPDDKWVAYTSDESGRAQVYVQPFPPTGAKWQISNDGGTEARWRGDGRTLYYLDPGRGIMAAAVDTSSGFRHTAPVLQAPVRGAVTGGGATGFDVTQDGRRFLIRERAEEPDPAAPMHVILNWPALLTTSPATPTRTLR